MEVIKFELSGRTACFRKPDVNQKNYYTYNNIHKIALLGMIGAIIGLSGYDAFNKYSDVKREEPEYPEFYEKLMKMKVSVVPKAKNGYFSKKIQYINNSVGYASNENGRNLQVFEQWLENPCWDIYLERGEAAEDIWQKICEYIMNGKCKYIPYLGKNDHYAIIKNCEIINMQKSERTEIINSLFPGEFDDLDAGSKRGAYIFSEFEPTSLCSVNNMYEFTQLLYTNCSIKKAVENVYTDGNINIAFY